MFPLILGRCCRANTKANTNAVEGGLKLHVEKVQGRGGNTCMSTCFFAYTLADAKVRQVQRKFF